MAEARINGINLYYEIAGHGFPLVLSHEFAGDYTSWDAQVKFFSRRYQVITYNHRGYPPSEVPPDVGSYSQDTSIEDLNGLLDHLGIRQAHIVGLSMGGNVALNFGFAHPDKARSLVIAATGSGSSDPERFRSDGEIIASRLDVDGMEAFTEVYSRGPARVQLIRKDPKGFEEFRRGLAAHSAKGSANTWRGVLTKRPSLLTLGEKMRALDVPTLVIIGDEDDLCVEPAIFMKRNIPSCGLSVFPQCGHAINLEEPDLFNRTILDFLVAVEAGLWEQRDPTVEVESLLPQEETR